MPDPEQETPTGGIDICTSCGWSCDTAIALGGATQEWEMCPDPDDLTTPLGPHEALLDGGATATRVYDANLMQCLLAVAAWALTEAMQQVGQEPQYLNARIRHLHIRKVRIRKR